MATRLPFNEQQKEEVYNYWMKEKCRLEDLRQKFYPQVKGTNSMSRILTEMLNKKRQFT